MSKQNNPLKGIFNTSRFGLFVITAGITAAGSLGLPEIFGITLGHLVIATTSKVGAIDLLSPLFTFLGLFFIRQYKNPGNIIGPLIFVLLTSLWLSYVGISVTGLDILPVMLLTLITQFGIVAVGYEFYLLAKQLKIFK